MTTPDPDPTDPDDYAEEVGIDPTPDQVDHYVELAEERSPNPADPDPA
ncbi:MULTISPECIES: hypothetical protein [Actinokineospora]|nr:MULTISPECIES: hypothetical protein [Actinokineospora]UVS79812.1 hypothetical protein Actkin_03562 [Actinokineospora sp. UTMC 2448]